MVAPKPYVVVDGTPGLSDRKTPAMDEQLEIKEGRILEFKKREYLAQHIILSTTSVHLGAKIKQLNTAEAMWKIVKVDATTKSTLYLLDAEDQLSTMKIHENKDLKSYLAELKAHSQTMVQHRNNLTQMGSTLSETQFNTIIMSSLPESYQPSLQTITATERVNKLAGGQSSGIKSDDLMAFLIEEAQHRLINEQRGKNAKLALAAYSKSSGKIKSAKKDKSDKPKSGLECDNRKWKGHVTEDCFAKGGGKEGQAPWQNNGKQKEAATIVEAKDDEEEMFAFTCTSNYTDIAAATPALKSSFGTCINSRASNNYSPDWTKFSNYQEINKDISTADGHFVKAIGMGDLHLELPNGSKTMKVTFKDAIHSPSMAFTLLSIGKLNTSGHKVTFHKQMCTIQDSKGSTIVQIPHLQGLYKVIMDNKDKPTLQANAAAGKMTISEAHHKLGHISSVVIKHTVSKGFITGITLDNNSKPEFCDACAKVKSAHKPFPQESDT